MASIEKLKTCIRIVWMQDGKKHRETLQIKPTPEGIQEAKRIGDMIEQQISMGIFDRNQIFPNSPKRPQAYFQHYISIWKNSESKTVAPTTWETYQSKVDNHITKYWGKTQIAKITPEKFEYWVYNVLLIKLSPKTIRDIIRLWRQIWSYWARHQTNPNDPTQYIKLSSRDPDDINPFTIEEINKIIAAPATQTLHNLWVVMLWSGLSTHELLPLAIQDIDTTNGDISINRGFVKGNYRATKTRRRKRQIQLLPIAMDAINDQINIVKDTQEKNITVLNRDHNSTTTEKLIFLWQNPNTNNHYTYPQLEKRWKSHLSKAGVAYRPLNNCRHTYASQVLSTGAVSAEWLANQLGHVDTDMIHKHYAKFIPKDSKHIIKNLQKALNQ